MSINISGQIDSLIAGRKLHWRLDHALRGLARTQGIFFDNISGPGRRRSFIFCTAYVKDHPRYRRWLEYMEVRREYFDAEAIFLVNDGSEGIDFDNRVSSMRYDQLSHEYLRELNLVWFDSRLGRPSMFCYPGWWRSFTFSVKIAREFGFDKIIHIESDAYVLSRRLVEYIKSINCGWTAMWSPTYAFPETSIQIICADAFPRLAEFASRGEDFFRTSNRAAEFLLPFDKVEARFKGERCGQLQRDRLPAHLDFIAQVPIDWALHPDF